MRGHHLGLTQPMSNRDANEPARPITLELLALGEVGDDDLGRALILFDPDDVDAAFDELDARYLAGEAAAHAAHLVDRRGGAWRD